MRDVAQQLKETVEEAAGRLSQVSEASSARRPAAGAWSAREILGHLVDSASVNHQRFVRAQLQDDMVFPGYEQESWVALQRYQETSWGELVRLWRDFNLHIARVMDGASDEALTRPRPRHNLDETAFRPVPRDQPATLEYFMRDYVWHLNHHLEQIRGLVAPAGAGHRP